MSRISTIGFYERASNAILDQQRNLLLTQAKLASGKKNLAPSDDPVSYDRIYRFNQSISHLDQYEDNINTVNNKLSQEETTLNAIMAVIDDVRNLQTQANSGALSTADKTQIADEVTLRLGDLVSLVNSKDSNGDHLFGGFKSQTTPYTQNANGSYSYNGDDGQRFLEVAESIQVPISDSGFSLFENIPNGNGTFVTGANAANTGTGTINTGTVSNYSAWVPDNYSITFSLAGSTLQYTVTRAGSGAAVVAATNYTEGADISFNGIKVKISGTPAAGDVFTANSSSGQSVFTTIQNIATAIQTTGSAGQTQMQTSMQNLDNAKSRVLEKVVQIGFRMNLVDEQQQANQALELTHRSIRSSLEDLDYAEAASQMSRQSLALQAAQQAFVKIKDLNLFNFL